MPRERLAYLIARESQWLNYLTTRLRGLRHPLVQLQSRRLDRLVTASYHQAGGAVVADRVMNRQRAKEG